MSEFIKFSEVFDEMLLTRYYTQEHEGLCYFRINATLKEKIKTMQVLAVIGSPYVEGFRSVDAYLKDDIDTVYFIPEQEPQFVSYNENFVNSYHKGKNMWCLNHFVSKKVKAISQVPIEAIFIEVSAEYFWITSVPYENPHFSTRTFTVPIRISEIGI